MRILVVEDEPDLAAALRVGLTAEGYTTIICSDGLDGLHHARIGDVDLIVLDLMLPHLSGYAITQRLRAEGIATPILILTAKTGNDDQTEALDAGADDYLTKPFAFTVLLARLRALARRAGKDRDVLQAGSVRIDARKRTAHYADAPIPLSPTEFRLLETLAQHVNEPVAKHVLLAELWSDDHPTENALEVRIAGLRRRLEAVGAGHLVRTVRGHGYRLIAQPRDDDAP